MKSGWKSLAKTTLVPVAAGILAVMLTVLPYASVQAAPAGWTKTRPGNIESNIKDTCFLASPSQNEGWAVGSADIEQTSGTTNVYHAWHTSNGGATWGPQTIGNMAIFGLPFAEMESVYFRDNTHGWTCGQYGFISRCSDGTTGAWTVVRGGSASEVLQDIFAPTDNEVWACGVDAPNVLDPSTYSPVVLHSINGGFTWSTIDLKDVAFADANNGWAVGPAGAIIHTTDGGSTWSLQNSNTRSDLNAIYATNASEAWAAGAGGTVLQTTNGTTWNVLSQLIGSASLTSISFPANSDPTIVNGWFAGADGSILAYNNGAFVPQASGLTTALNGISLVWDGASSNYLGAAVGAGGHAIYTTDSGATWSGANPGTSANLNSVVVISPTSALLCGDYDSGSVGTVRVSTNAGHTWTSPTTRPATSENLKSISFANVGHDKAWVVGAHGVVFTADNPWDTWSAQTSGVGHDLNSISVYWDGAQYLLTAVGAQRTIVRSIDSGTTWTSQSGIPSPGALLAGSPVNSTNLYFGGVNVGAARGMIIHSTNGGGTFNSEAIGIQPTINGICAADANDVWAVGDSGMVQYWDGATWAPQASTSTANLLDVSCADSGGGTFPGVIAGDDGTALYSADASAMPGGGWAAATTNINKNSLYSCTYDAAGPYTHYAGDSGTLLSSGDGGATIGFQVGPGNLLYGTSFYDADHGYACGANGTIVYTADGGTTWTAQDSTTHNDLYAISAIDHDHVAAVGANGTVLFFDGMLWSDAAPGPSANKYLGVKALDTSHVWVVGEAGTIWFFDGIGPMWHSQNHGTDDLNAVCALDATHVWAVGSHDPGGGGALTGVALFSNGTTWTDLPAYSEALYGVNAISATHVWACGHNGKITESINGGTNWSDQHSGGAELRGIKMMDSMNGFAVGLSDTADQPATILNTTDGGATWTLQDPGTVWQRSLYAVDGIYNSATHHNDMYAAGQWGMVQKYFATAAVPQITPPFPTSGVAGTNITINGTDFGADQATVNGHVLFNGVDAGTAISWTDTVIHVAVPAGAYGYNANLRVVTDGGSSNSVPFTTVPAISGATSPVYGGQTVTITGTGFGPDPTAGHRSSADNHVTIEGALVPDAAVTSWSNTQIQAVLPNSAAPGTGAEVIVTAGDASNSSAPFDITVVPHVTGLTGNPARPGDTVTVTGTNFGPDPGAGNRHASADKVTINTSTGPQTVGVGGTVEPTSWSNTAIVFDVPYVAGTFVPRTGNLVVTGGSQVSNNTTLTIVPKIDSVSAANGAVGDPITLNGRCFGDTQGTSRVLFINTQASSYTQWDDMHIVAIVPDSNLTAGTLKVTTVGGDSDTRPFTLLPYLDSLSAVSGRVGDRITLTGTGFGLAQGTSTVTMNGTTAAAAPWGKDSISVNVPADATTGPVIVNTNGGTTSSGPITFTVMPKITTMSPATIVPGETMVTISGFTFGAAQGTSHVDFNGVRAGTATSWSKTSIVIKAPKGCTTGNVTVTTPDGVSNGFAFNAGPRVTAISPLQGPPTGQITITGSNFKASQALGYKVTFNGVDAAAADSWSNTSIKVKVPYGAETGPVTVTTDEGVSNPVQFEVGLSKTYYFAEGTTRPNFEEWLSLMNPNDQAATVNMTYMLGDGTTRPQQVTVQPNSRMTLFVPDAVGANQDVSTKVTSTLPIMAERPMYFNYGGVWTGGHDVVGAIAPAPDWFFAEGNTRDGFDEWLCLQNPGTTTASVDITYMLQAGTTQVQKVTIPPTSRQTVDVKGFLGPNKDCSAMVHSNVGIIAERPMYFVYKPGIDNWTGGHDVVGANAPGKQWYFAEGTTRDGFDEWLCLQNPGSTSANATVHYMLESGEVLTQLVTVEGHSRKTIDVVAIVGRGRDVSMQVTSDQPVVAERPMYFDYVGLTGGHDVIGATCSSPNWYFAEGATQNGFQEWLSVQNPGNKTATVNITYMLGKGAPVTQSVTVNPHARATIDVNGAVGWGKDVSARVTTTGSVIVERPMYFNQHGWTGGHDVVGFHY